MSAVAAKARRGHFVITSFTYPLERREERESKENREGELDLICSFCDRDQEGFIPFSLKARGLVTDDLEDKLCRWMLLTKGRVENPP